MGVCVALCGAVHADEPANPIQPGARPNLVMIMADDLDTHILDTMLKLGLLPNIQQVIVQHGFRFNQSFVTNSLCCPSRSTYLSGQYSHNHGVHRNDPPNGGVESFDDGASRLPSALPRAGYRTAPIGKYLNNYGSRAAAPATSPENPHYVPPGWNRWEGLVDPSTYSVYNYTISTYNDRTDPAPAGTLVHHGNTPDEYQTVILAQRAADVIAEAREHFPHQPLFLTVTPIAPHAELFTMVLNGLDGLQYADQWRWFIRPNPADRTDKPQRWNLIFNDLPLLPRLKPSFNEADVRDKPVAMRRALMTQSDIEALTFQYRTRFASMLAVDDLVGRVAEALGSDLERTVFLFTSDNGFLHGEHRMSEKLVPYEESIRVPLYLAVQSLQGVIDVDAIVLNNDLAPTLAALAGADLAPADGRSLLGLLGATPPATWRKRLLVEHWISQGGGALDVPDFAAVRTGSDDLFPERVYVEYYADAADPSSLIATELYDLTEPQGRFQLESRHADPARAAELVQLKQLLEALKRCGTVDGPACRQTED